MATKQTDAKSRAVKSPMHSKLQFNEFKVDQIEEPVVTLTQLRHLIALAEFGSFNRAATDQCLTQPALSRSVRALEDELRQPLFDRLGRRTELTPFGQQVLLRAKQLISDAEDLLGASQDLSTGRAGRVRIGMGSGPGAILSSPMLQYMSKHHPRMHFEITRGNTELLIIALRERSLDALVIDARSLPPAEDLKLLPLAELRGGFLCRADHPLAHKRQVSIAQIRRFAVASSPLSQELALELVERYGADAHPHNLVTLRCDEIASLVDVVRKSDAILLSVRAAAPDLKEIDIQPPLTIPAKYGLVTMARRSQTSMLPLMQRLITSLLVEGSCEDE